MDSRVPAFSSLVSYNRRSGIAGWRLCERGYETLRRHRSGRVGYQVRTVVCLAPCVLGRPPRMTSPPAPIANPLSTSNPRSHIPSVQSEEAERAVLVEDLFGLCDITNVRYSAGTRSTLADRCSAYRSASCAGGGVVIDSPVDLGASLDAVITSPAPSEHFLPTWLITRDAAHDS